jgi:glycogen operon protein
MREEHWNEAFAKSMAVCLNGSAIRYPDPFGERIIDDSFFVLFNAHYEEIVFHLPVSDIANRWAKIMDTAAGGFLEGDKQYGPEDRIPVQGRSVVLLQHVGPRRDVHPLNILLR